MASNPAVVADVEARFERPLSSAELAVAATRLQDAWRILVRRVPSVPARLDAATLDVALVRQVLADMVVRVLRNPEGYKTEQIDDFTGVRDAATASGTLYVSDEEVALLTEDGSSSTAFTVRPFGVPDSTGVESPW